MLIGYINLYHIKYLHNAVKVCFILIPSPYQVKSYGLFVYIMSTPNVNHM